MSELGEYQLCPKCNGAGSMTPELDTTATSALCNLCHGKMVIARPVGPFASVPSCWIEDDMPPTNSTTTVSNSSPWYESGMPLGKQ